MSKGIVREDNVDYIIFKNIKDMCVPLEKMFKDMNIDQIKSENFFPYISSDKKYGYFLKQPDNTYKDLSQANWRSILHGQKLKLRPKDKLPRNNRMKAYDNDSCDYIEVCYWPDNYLESHSNDFKKKQSKTSSVNLGSSKILAQFTKTALYSTSFEFLQFGKQQQKDGEAVTSDKSENVQKDAPISASEISISKEKTVSKESIDNGVDTSFLFCQKKRKSTSVSKTEHNLGDTNLLFKYTIKKESTSSNETPTTVYKFKNEKISAEPLKLWKCLFDKGLDTNITDENMTNEIEKIFSIVKPKKRKLNQNNDDYQETHEYSSDSYAIDEDKEHPIIPDQPKVLPKKKKRRIVY
jgi:hypothetical protein